MKIAAIKERAPNELRAAITPETTKLYIKQGYTVFVEQSIGIESHFSDEEYRLAGAKVSAVPLEILADADIILKVQPSPSTNKINEVEFAKTGTAIIGLLLSQKNNNNYYHYIAEKKLSMIAMERLPRTTITQNMDVLSSQSNLAGYRAILEAAYYYNKGFPMLMTAAGTIQPAKILVIGVGVAGLQAIATAKRLGAIVFAYDVRAATKEQVESLGAKFIHPHDNLSDGEGQGGYAKEVTTEFAKVQKQFLSDNVHKFDIIITTAQIPEKPAPLLIDSAMIDSMKKGAVILDMATSSGGNVSESQQDIVVNYNGIKIIGFSNLAAKISHDATRLYAKNVYNFINHVVKNQKINLQDNLITSMLIHN